MAVTGRGQRFLGWAWRAQSATVLPRKRLAFGDPDAADGLAWADWFFEAVGGGFPAQIPGLRAFYGGATHTLCLVAEADAPTGMGGVVKIRKGAVTLVLYLVETSDPDATPIYVRTSSGTKAVRELT